MPLHNSFAIDAVVMTIMAQAGGLWMSRTVSQYVVGWIPFIGNAVNGASMAAMVELIGWKIAKAYDNDEFASIELVKNTVKKGIDSVLGEDATDTILEYIDGLIDDDKK